MQEGILRVLDKLRFKLGLVCMFITHDLATMRPVADDGVVMPHGRVVAQGTSQISAAHQPYTELLLSSLPRMDPEGLPNLLTARADPA